jgi:hypothetical protein
MNAAPGITYPTGFLDLVAQIDDLLPQHTDVDTASTSETPPSNTGKTLRIKPLADKE